MKEKVISNKKGISLIVLVITIIVMIILAGAVILTISNTNILDRAEQAVDATNLSEVQTLASTLWAEAYLEGARTQEEFEKSVTEGLKNVDTSDYKIVVTTSGVEVKSLDDIWIQEGLTVKKGSTTMNIGDIVHYDETNGRTDTGLIETEWKVLGVNEDGELLIMSTEDIVASYTLGELESSTISEKSKTDYVTGAKQLNDLCLPYKEGKGATGARSITVEDVNKITGYVPETELYGAGNTYQYGNEVTYAWDETGISYTSAAASGSTSYIYSAFTWYDEETGTWISVNKGDTTTALPTLKSTYYKYAGSSKLDTDTVAYKMLFRNSGDTANANYWLASPCVYTSTYDVYFGVRIVSSGNVSGTYLVYSRGVPNSYSRGVRAVVSLSSDIKFTGSSAEGWTF